MRGTSRLLSTVCVIALAAAPALAQPPTATQPLDSTSTEAFAPQTVTPPLAATASNEAPAAAAAGPTRQGAVAGVRRAAAPAHDAAAAPAIPRTSQRQSEALMIVGGAAIVVGILVGDDLGALLAVGGAVVGLYGLYNYLMARP
jgi:hypothetical protein